MLDTVLVVVIAFLVVILVVPLVSAAVRAIRRRRARRPEPSPRPRVSLPPTAKVPVVAAPPAPPAPESTQMIDLGKVKPAAPAADAPQSTEMVEWYGMLVCSGGPLNGQAFIVEADGIYIGRDAEMSQVVINDSRVSKRHVRVVPRNGKVYAIDQNSTNGTYLGQPGGERISEVELKRGSVIVLGDNVASFTYQI